ncbi:winged helix-turn-helix domain-containing protein [Actinomadura sp. HBU206391]|uniref:winged helix-turn-helix domain-containing protein n=1 Tax=Actinomadura sp. HBU206391 TaxID=2731692 RepID=UPI002905B899|nr:crosslink repair DNA glycosylase YcaQ family protein [Actinomadura sp. HBU206391]
MAIPSHENTGPSRENTVEISADDARRAQLRAQGLVGAEGRRGGVPGMLARLGAVQLDTISVLARSHELVPYARLGPVGRARVEGSYWGPRKGGATTFEYWCHAACLLPVRDWPYYSFRRRAFREREYRWHKVPEHAPAEVLARLKGEGPLTATQLGGARGGGEWWDWSDTKIAVEWLLDIGEVVCVQRVGWRRVYDLAERALPAGLAGQEPDDATCVTHLAGVAGRALGVATRADLVEFLRLRREQATVLDGLLADGATGLVPVRVTGWRPDGARVQAWADPAALASPVRGRHRTTLLSPFDSLIWDRKRTSRVFGFDHRLEAYVPKDKRVHGYFTMPLLAGGDLIGRVDPAREDGTLVARRVSFEPRATRTPARAEAALAALHTALWEAAGWVGCEDVRIEIVDPPALAEPTRRAMHRTLKGTR